MDFSNQKPTKENSDYFLCGICFAHFRGEKHLLLCKCPAKNPRCPNGGRNGGCIRCSQQSIGFNVENLLCASCFTPVTKQDVEKVLEAAKKAAADCCLGARCQRPGLDRQTEIECPNEDCFNRLHRECIHSLNLTLMNYHPEESIHINCPLCDYLLIDWSPPPIAFVPNPIEAEEQQDGEPMNTSDESGVPSL